MKFYVIDAYDVAEKTGMGGRINTVRILATTLT